MLPLAFVELSGTWTEQNDFKIEKSQEGLKPTRTDSTNFNQFSIPYFVNKDSPVYPKLEKW